MAGIERARRIVQEFARVSHNSSYWEHLVEKSDLQPLGCIMDAVGIDLAGVERSDAAYYAAQALRRRFPEYTRSAQAWRDKRWDAVVIEAILATVLQAIDEYRLSTRAAVDERRYVPLGDVRQPSGFMPWRLFKHRAPVTRAPGIYVFAYFEGDPEPVVDPLSRNVIYIGKATSIASRLEHFETSAQSAEIGHSGGFSYRVQFAEMQFGSNPILLRQFHNTFCTWRIVSLKAEHGPREVERALIAAYRNKWGNWPILNRTS